MDGKFISYLRVSTDKQGRSGLGLEAQRAAVTGYLNGGAWTLLAEFVEVESGKATTNRPQLEAALKLAKLTGATLLIAKLDRLSRDAHFLLGMSKAGVRIICADNPNMNEMTFGIMAVIAEHERKVISERTKVALAAAKARGTVMGGYRGFIPDAAAGGAARAQQADAFAADVAPIAREMQSSGASLRTIAAALADQGIRTPRGGAWTATAVRNVLAR